VVGDRFVLQSELLFDPGSAEIGPEGRAELAKVADTLKQIAATIPEDVPWILRVDGHTDRQPINSSRFASNWDLSTARAVAVVQYLISRGLPPERLAAAGFGEYKPLDGRDDEIAYRRNRRIEFKLTES
jgi:chemotaxis protein MotB